jgi:hypothetical protein
MAQSISTTSLTKDFTTRLTERLTGSGHLESLIDSHLSSQLSAFTSLTLDTRIWDLEVQLLAFEYAVQIACEFPAKLKQRLLSHTIKSQHVDSMGDGRVRSESSGGNSIPTKDTTTRIVPEISNTIPISQYAEPAIDLRTRNKSSADELMSKTNSTGTKPTVNSVEPQKAATAARGITQSPVPKRY